MASLGTPEYLTSAGWYFTCDGVVNERRSIASITGLSMEVPALAGEAVGQSYGYVDFQSKPGGFAKYPNIVIKVVATAERDLYDWFWATNPIEGGMSLWNIKKYDATVTALNAKGQPVVRFEIRQCYPCKYSAAEFDVKSELAYESFELVHTRWMRTQ